MWTGANVSTAMYAATNLNDVWLASVSAIYSVCCIVVIIMTALKRADSHRCTRHCVLRSASVFGCQSQQV
jgi:hypothetical protein